MSDNETTPRHRADSTTDAKSRALRTLAQGAAITALVAVASTVQLVVAGWQPEQVMQPESWAALGTTAVVALLTSVASYVSAHLVPPAPAR